MGERRYRLQTKHGFFSLTVAEKPVGEWAHITAREDGAYALYVGDDWQKRGQWDVLRGCVVSTDGDRFIVSLGADVGDTEEVAIPASDPSDWAAGPTQITGDPWATFGPATLLTSKDGGETWAETKAEIVCPDCNGTKVYVGLNETRPCPTRQKGE